MKIKVSKHAEQRMRERCGLNKKSIERIAQKAYNKGIKHESTKGRLNKWITCVYFKNTKANNIRLYGDMLYIFCDNVLVTVFQIPHNIAKNLSDYTIK